MTTNNPSVSNRLVTMPVSAVRKLSPYAKAAKADGVKIYHLNIGDPDIPTPQPIMDALHSFDINPIRYADSHGEPVFLQALESYYHNLGASSVNESQIVITVGGSEAVVMSFFATCQEGDEVLVFEPFYSNYASCAALAGVTLVSVATTIENGFHLPEKEVIEEKINPKTKAMLICSPSNPTGTVYSKEEMQLLVDIAKQHSLFLISDEVYREFVYDGKEQISLLSFMQQIPEHAIILDSLSKRYNLCGARLGIFMSLNADLVAGVIKIAQSRLSAGIIEQIIAAKISELPASYMFDMIAEYKKRRDVLYEELQKIPGVFLTKPEGAFYTMVSLPVEDAEQFCIYLLQEFRIHNETVMLAPGAGFYETTETGKNQVRIAYVLNAGDLKKSVEILRAALEEYKKS